METFDIIYIIDAVVFAFLIGKTAYHQIKKQHQKVELSFFIMLVFAIVVLIQFFVHALYILAGKLN